MGHEHIQYLICLARKNNIYRPIVTSTLKLAERFDMSQQSVSRILISLETEGLIKRSAGPQGVRIELTERAVKRLKQTYDLLDSHFSKKALEFYGTVERGIGEGKYYVSMYREHFRRKLRIRPYLGTLNLKVKIETVKKIRMMFKPVVIDGFTTEERTFGWIKCYRCIVDKTRDCFITMPERTAHPDDIIEVISEKYLRNLGKRRLKIKVV